jgi:hypothetical protein
MKTALAIVCSLLLVGTLFVPAQAPAAGAAGSAPACCPCSGQSCCAAQPSPESRPVSAAPGSSTLPPQFLTPLPAALAWTLPGASAPAHSALLSSPPIDAGISLFARNCARLI